jgi:hypothetical protein
VLKGAEMTDINQEQVISYKTARYYKLSILLVIVVMLNIGGAWLSHQIDFQLFPRHEPILHAIVLIAVALYVLLMAIPFMPGIEIGLALMLLLGSKGAIMVYLCTLLALSISFTVGRKIPAGLICLLLNWLHLYKASALVRQLESLNQQERLELLYKKAPSRIAPFLLNHRYLAIAVVINFPGNALIGGGGGIGLIVGMSRIIPFHAYLGVLVIAIAPVPLWFFLQ